MKLKVQNIDNIQLYYQDWEFDESINTRSFDCNLRVGIFTTSSQITLIAERFSDHKVLVNVKMSAVNTLAIGKT